MSRMLGLIGGMAWPSTALYYRRINSGYHAARGRAHSAPLLIWSFDFEALEVMQRVGDWVGLTAELCRAATALSTAGVGALLLCTNTMHKVHAALEDASGLPLLHIADAVGTHAKGRGIDRAALLGTRFTMGESFYKDRIAKHGIEVLTPPTDDAATTDDIIFSELINGDISDLSRERMRGVVARLAANGAQAVILGCTELGLLDDGGDWAAPLIDTVTVHADAALDWLLARPL